MDIKSKFTNLLGAEIFLTVGEIELIVNSLTDAEEQAENDYNNELIEFQKSKEDQDYYLVEITEKRLQEIRVLLNSFEDLLQSNN